MHIRERIISRFQTIFGSFEWIGAGFQTTRSGSFEWTVPRFQTPSFGSSERISPRFQTTRLGSFEPVILGPCTFLVAIV